jgi:HlyD family secretion protein
MALLNTLTNRRVLLTGLVIAVLLGVALWPRATSVNTAVIGRGPLLQTIDEEGRTRVRDRFVVAAPVAGRVLRIELEAGDTVSKGQIVARVRAEAPPLLDARTTAEAQAAIESARASLGRAKADEQRARSTLTLAQRELKRVRELMSNELTTAREVESREADVRTSEEAVNAAAFAVRAAESEVVRAEARLAPARETPGRVVDVLAPIDGVVLKRDRESESIVPAGDPLVELGDPTQLEIVADLLSTDAVKVPVGARALIEQWGGNQSLDAKVRRVEPSGFTKISALGVEEQRVNVILDFVNPASAWKALGDGYRVEVRVVIWESANVLKVPTGALFRVGDRWAVYVVDQNRARQTFITLGHQTGQDAEVTDGLAEGAHVILHPSDTLADGARVAATIESR